MTIEGKDFKLIPISEATPRFDLELLYTVRPKDGEERKEFKNVAYGISLEHAIQRISHYRVSNNHKEESIELITYLKEFLETMDVIKKECQG